MQVKRKIVAYEKLSETYLNGKRAFSVSDLSNTYLSVLFSFTSIRLYHHLRLSIY